MRVLPPASLMHDTSKTSKTKEHFSFFNDTDVPMPVELIDVPSVVSSDQMTLKWRKPNDNGAAITGYAVYQRSVSEHGGTSEWQFINSTSDCKYVIKLERGKKFDFIVTAKNRCGESLKAEDNVKRVEMPGMFTFYALLSFFLFDFDNLISDRK